jgi:adenylate cyclase
MSEQRRLAAILVADVVDYSKLVGSDEAGTLAQLHALRMDIIEPQIAKHAGRLFKSVGDGFLIEFASAVRAVSCAKAIQEANALGRLPLRIGIHVGDVVVQDDDLMGDGVNIAARIEGVAEARGIAVSRAVHEQVRDKLDLSFEDKGELALKNLIRPVQVFMVAGHAPPAAVAPAFALPDKPSIAVLPFQNMSGDPEQEYFTDGITEDIITELSRFHSLFVIARNSSFSYKGKSPDIRLVGRELGVRYILEGSIRKSSNRIRATGQLVDTLTGSHIWAERYDRVLEDIFAVQEEVTQAIVAAIAPQIESTELSKASRRRPNNLTAYELALRATAHAREALGRPDQTLLERSIREAREALAIDPGSVQALQALSYAHGTSLLVQMAVDREQTLGQATWAATRAIELDGSDALAYSLRALAILRSTQRDRYPDALLDIRRARQLNPNDVEVLRVLAALETGVGEAEQAIVHAQQALRLNPRDPFSYGTFNLLAFATFGAKQYAECIGWALRALNNMPGMIQVLDMKVAGLVGMGEVDKAKTAFETLQKLAPEYARSRLEGTTLYGRTEDRARFQTFLRIAAGLEDPSAAEPLR